MMSESTESTQPAAPTPNRRNSPVRDAVTIGIFIALYIVLFFICGMTMGAIPLIMVLLPVIFGIFGGLIFMVLLGKVQRSGAFLISSVIVGLFLITMAPGGTMCYMTILGGVAAEFVYARLGRRSFRSMTAACSIYMLCFAIGEYVPFVWMKQAYLDQYAGNAALEVARAGTRMLNPATMAGLCLGAVIASAAGCWWGRALTRRQFKRAGIV